MLWSTASRSLRRAVAAASTPGAAAAPPSLLRTGSCHCTHPTNLGKAATTAFLSTSTSSSAPSPEAEDASNKEAQPPRSQDSTSALDYKLHHRLRRLPPLPSIEPPPMEASEAVSNILYNTPAPSKEPFKRCTSFTLFSLLM